MTLDADEYSKLSLDEQNEYDTKQRKQVTFKSKALSVKVNETVFVEVRLIR